MGTIQCRGILSLPFLDRPDAAPESFTSTNVNCFSLASLTHNAGAAFDSTGGVTLAVHAWNSASEASTKISKSDEMEERINELLMDHAGEANAYFEAHPYADECSWSWTTNDVPVNFRNEQLSDWDEYDLHISFGKVVVSRMTVSVVVNKRLGSQKLYISQLTLSGHFEDLYDFDFERGGLNADGAVLQLGWDANNSDRNAGHIFFGQVDFGHAFSSLFPLSAWSFDFERMDNETNAIPTP